MSAVLEALSKKVGPEDDRTLLQRNHDALEEACRRLAGSGLPDAAGQPTQIQLHMTLSQLRELAASTDPAGSPQPGQDSGACAEDGWLAARGTASGVPGWVSDAGAGGYGCDAAITPVVTGVIDPDVLDQLINELGQAWPAGQDRKRIEDLILHAAVGLPSGPGGLTAYLRTSLTGTRLALPSLPLDVGQADKIPAHLRRLVAVRHPRCAFPGCGKQARHSHVHHVIPRSEGGATALDNLVPLCAFHHLIAIHRWGWKLALNSDGTTTATSPDGRKIRHSHGHGPPEHGAPFRDPPGQSPAAHGPPANGRPGHHPPGHPSDAAAA